MPSVEGSLSMCLGAVFVASSIPKLRRPRAFILSVLQFEILPDALARLYGRLLPRLELLVAILLLSGVGTRIASALSALMLTSFIVGIAANLLRGRHLECNCFGKRNRQISWMLVAEDTALTAVAGVIFVNAQTWLAPEPWSPLQAADALGAIALFPLLLIMAVRSNPIRFASDTVFRKGPHRDQALPD